MKDDKVISITKTNDVSGIIVEAPKPSALIVMDAKSVEETEDGLCVMLGFQGYMGMAFSKTWVWVENDREIVISVERWDGKERKLSALVFIGRLGKEVAVSDEKLEEKIFVSCNRFKEFMLKLPLATVIEFSERMAQELENWNAETYARKKATFVSSRIRPQNKKCRP